MPTKDWWTDRKRVVLEPNYVPSRAAANFHRHQARFRYSIWGIKSGKTKMGAIELCRAALAIPNAMSWIVTPTYNHLKVAEREVMSVLLQFPGVIERRNRVQHEIVLTNGHIIEGKSAEYPDNLRGPNLVAVWLDEASWVKEEAWWIVRGRVSATMGDIFITTTPKGRNWVWKECQLAGLPSHAPYGEFENGNRYVSHFPTWHFRWVPKEEIEETKKTMPRHVFDTEFGAEFVTDSGQVFRHTERAISLAPPQEDENATYVLGWDLGKFQDPSGVLVLSGSGRIVDVQGWKETEWTIQKVRILELAKKWKAAIVIDRSNVGSTIEEDMRNDGVDVFAIDMNAPQIKTELIQALQMAFEQGRIKIPDPRCEWSPPDIQELLNELDWYEHTLTPSGRVSYSAPKGLHDDRVIALALANWGRMRGLAGGSNKAESAFVSKEDMDKIVTKRIAMRRPQIFSSIFGKHKSSIGLQGPDGPFWR